VSPLYIATAVDPSEGRGATTLQEEKNKNVPNHGVTTCATAWHYRQWNQNAAHLNTAAGDVILIIPVHSHQHAEISEPFTITRHVIHYFPHKTHIGTEQLTTPRQKSESKMSLPPPPTKKTLNNNNNNNKTPTSKSSHPTA